MKFKHIFKINIGMAWVESMKKLCLMNACDEKYSNFIVPYVYFSSLHNEDVVYEFLLTEEIGEEKREAIKNISSILDRNIILRDFRDGISPLKLRFIEKPISKCEYTYIGDIDIFILEDIVPFHEKMMEENKLCYDNYVRPNNKDFMSGLHFCNEEYFKATENARKKYSKKEMFNEKMLFEICKESGLRLLQTHTPEEFIEKRPVHGIHVSLNRKPFVEKGMEFGYEEKFKEKFIDATNSNLFNEKIKPLFTDFFLRIYNKIIDFI